MYKILVVDDVEELRQRVASVLKAQGYEVDLAVDGQDAAQKLAKNQYPLVLCDVKMPNMDGFEFLRFVREQEFSTAVALLTAHGNVNDAIAAIREGAFDYVEKPIDEERLIALVQKAERAYEMLHRVSYSAPVLDVGEEKEFVGQSQGMKRIFQLIERLARVNTSVLIRGENGTGKELVARAIHYNSPRKNHPFVAINCAAIPETLIESELFGHEKGAFTGAEQRKIGKFQYAANGTIFLDEIGDTSPATQVKLLRVLQEHAFTPVGSNREVKADVRVIAASNRNLEKLIQEGKFREDLFYRLSVMPIFLPALRERKGDIPALVQHFIDKFNADHHGKIQSITPEALDALEAYHWPGNIRELENAIEHAFVLENTSQITYFSLPEYLRHSTRKVRPIVSPETLSSPASIRIPSSMNWEEGKEVFEREFIIQALRHHGGRINVTAERANIPKNTLLRKIKKYKINPKEYGATLTGVA